jgi:hypothetical protein
MEIKLHLESGRIIPAPPPVSGWRSPKSFYPQCLFMEGLRRSVCDKVTKNRHMPPYAAICRGHRRFRKHSRPGFPYVMADEIGNFHQLGMTPTVFSVNNMDHWRFFL